MLLNGSLLKGKTIAALFCASVLGVSLAFAQQPAAKPGAPTPAKPAATPTTPAHPAHPTGTDVAPKAPGATLETPAENLPLTTIQFEKTEHDFGKITQEAPVTIRYKFKNTGSNPLKISNARGSCGCTTPNWSKEPIAPGGEGFVEAQFNPKGRPGMNHKTVTVTCNSEAKTHTLSFKAEVQEEKPAGEKAAPMPAPATTPK